MADHGLHYRYHPLPSPVKVQIFTYNRLRVFKIANTARLGRGEGQERGLHMGPSEKYVAC